MPPARRHRAAALRLLLPPLLLLLATLAGRAAAQDCNHQAHAVPAADVTVFDLDGSGAEDVGLDGSLSHSHYFQPGPPIINGEIVDYVWRRVSDGVVVCRAVRCTVSFGVGQTELELTVTDQTGDAASDFQMITVLPAGDATGTPTISSLQPAAGPTGGGTRVTVNGANFFNDAVVTFGGNEATNVNFVSTSKVEVTAPPGAAGDAEVVVTSNGKSGGGAFFSYEGGGGGGGGGGGPVAWEEDRWRNPDGSVWKDAQEVSGIVIGPDGNYYLSTLSGKVWKVSVDSNNVVTSACSGAQHEEARSLYGIAWNPYDQANRLLVTSNIMFWNGRPGGNWKNGRVEFVNIDDGGCVSRGDQVITGLPMSDHDHGCAKMAFDNSGGMLLTCGGTTNAGVADAAFGNIDESPLSGAIVYAPYLSPGFDGAITYSTDDPGSATVTGGGVSVYAPGFRNSFGLIKSSKGHYYATDNGPNVNFGATSTSCTTQIGDANAGDSLHRVQQNAYHGHPNRNRGRNDPNQCIWRPDGNWRQPIGFMEASTNGIVEYTGNTFGGQIKGDLFLSKFAGGGNSGKVFQVNLNGDGWAEGAPFEIWGNSGLQIVMSPQGALVMPRVKQYEVVVLKPVNGGAVRMLQEAGGATRRAPEVHSVWPQAGRWMGGNDVRVHGAGFTADTIVRMGGEECEYQEFISAEEILCQVPPRRGRGHVTAETAGLFSSTHGTHDYEWL